MQTKTKDLVQDSVIFGKEPCSSFSGGFGGGGGAGYQNKNTDLKVNRTRQHEDEWLCDGWCHLLMDNIFSTHHPAHDTAITPRPSWNLLDFHIMTYVHFVIILNIRHNLENWSSPK